MADSTKPDTDADAPTDAPQSPWLRLAGRESIARMIDALLGLPPHREFTQTELADLADVSRTSVHRHLDLLLEIEVIEPVEGTNRYRFDEGSEVSRALFQLEGALNAAGPYAPGGDADAG